MRLACRVGGWIEDPASSIQHLLPKKLYPQCKLNAEDSVSTLEGRVASYRSPELQAIFGVTLMAVLGVSSIAPALPRIAATLGVSAGQVGLLVTAFTLPAVTVVSGYYCRASSCSRSPAWPVYSQRVCPC
jgi:hypothetical protein